MGDCKHMKSVMIRSQDVSEELIRCACLDEVVISSQDRIEQFIAYEGT